ncbi:MAG TPA: adenylate/guanylate cyclase domain-containing protein [Mycobacteriales bacterium]|nr:adenylate/guanylate cyclase domain-containing protein [Mycobacteriales bacterium]
MVPAEQVEAAPERRLVTMLFADLSGYTELCARLDPEDVHDVVRPAMRALRAVAESFGATVPGIQGDGFLAIFGAPLAHEDDAERAVRAAFGLHDALRQINTGDRPFVVPELHIGINTGEVAVWSGGGPLDVSVAGEAVNLASRLCGLAAPGEVCVGARTVELTRGRVDFDEATTTVVRGIAEPVAVYRALGINADAVAGRRTLSLKAGFVGRTSLLRELDVLLEAARTTQKSQVAVVVGEAGNGKSRLALEWSGSYDDVTVISAGCSAYDQGVLTPWSAIVAQLGEVEQVMPTGDDPVAAALHTLREFVEPLAGKQPVVLILDDLHWAPADSVRLLEEVHAAPWDVPVVVLGLTRPDGWSGQCPSYPLGPLDEAEMQDLLKGTLGTSLPGPVVSALMRRSGGNPLFLEECLALLVESGGVVIDEGTFEVDLAQVAAIPTSMRQFIGARLDALPTAEKSLVQDAAVAGDAVWDGWLTHVDPGRDVGALLDSLERRGLLRRSPATSVRGSREYVFKHALIREVAYGSLSRRTRADRHLSAAGWLADASTDSGTAIPSVLLAHHYASAWDLVAADTATSGHPRCGLASAAVEHLARHADELGAGQPRRAEATLTRALGIVGAAPECFPANVSADLATARAAARFDLQEYAGVFADLDDAEVVMDVDTEPSSRGWARRLRAQTLSALSRVSEAEPVFEEALALLQSAGDAVGMAHTLRYQAFNARLTDRRAYLSGLARAYDAFVAAGDLAGQRDVAIDLSYELSTEGGAAFSRWYAIAEASTDFDRDLRARASLRRAGAFVAQNRGENHVALELTRSAYADATAVGATRVTVDALICRLAATSALGAAEENERVFVAAVTLGDRLGLRRLIAMAHIHSARPRLLMRDLPTALMRVSVGRELLGEIGDLLNPDADLAGLAIARDSGDWSHASVLGEAAVVLLERQGEVLYAVPVRLDLGRAALVGDPGRAVVLLAEALDAARRQDTPQHGALAASCLEQAQLLSGQQTSQRIGTAPEHSVELEATASENSGLRHAVRGSWVEAAECFHTAATAWATIGSTVWLARALLWQSESARRAGVAQPAETVEVVDQLLNDLGSPAGLPSVFVGQLTSIAG